MRVIIDRFEGDYAVCEKEEDMSYKNIEIKKLPKDAKEGDVLLIEDEKIIIDKEATRIRKEEIEKLLGLDSML